MDRRAFLAGFAAVLAAPLAAEAQRVERVYRIGYLSIGSATGAVYIRPLEGFRQQLRELGWVEGRNIVIEFRFADGRADRLPGLAKELVRLKVDVITAVPTPAALAAKNATSTIPIVGMSLTEPVAVGLVASLARPGGNVTGVSYAFGTEIFGKQLELLRDVAPKVRRVAVLANPTSSPAYPQTLDAVRAAARSLGLELQLLEVGEPAEFDRTFAAMTKERADGLIVLINPMYAIQQKQIIDRAMNNKLPAIYEWKVFTQNGGLSSYGADVQDIYRRAAGFADKIIKGAKPADLPVERPTKVDLAINLKTAKALGLTVPPSLLARADAVIE